MIGLDRTSLDRVLPVTAGSADWNDVLGRSRVRARSRRVITLATVVAIAILATASAFAVRAIVFDGGGVTALPPDSAMPSQPPIGSLVLRYHGRPPDGPAVAQVWVYADGRVISRTFDGAVGLDGIRTGFLERRLTRESVAFLHAKVVATGLLERDGKLLARRNNFGSVQARRGKRLVTLAWGDQGFFLTRRPGRATDGEEAAIARITRWLFAAPAELPAQAWTSLEPRGYVPSLYAICFSRRRAPRFLPRRVPPSPAARFLPESARDLLAGRTRTFRTFGVQARCSQLPIDDTRSLYLILDAAGFRRDPLPLGTTSWGLPAAPDGLASNVRFQARRPNHTLFIAFEPILPHGQWELMPG